MTRTPEMNEPMKDLQSPCKWHRPWDKGYLERNMRLIELNRMGITPSQCLECLHFFVPEEMGDPEAVQELDGA